MINDFFVIVIFFFSLTPVEHPEGPGSAEKLKDLTSCYSRLTDVVNY